MRANNRKDDELRQMKITRNFTKFAEGSVLVEFGNTQVICNVSIDENLPDFVKKSNSKEIGSPKGWLSAEYSMLPRATRTRNKREVALGKQNSRSQEISRLIGRSLRASLDFVKLGPRQIIVDCDVIQADGGTRTASISGAFVALYDAITLLIAQKTIEQNPINKFLAAISVGIYQDRPVLDLDYEEDISCNTDMNVVMFEDNTIVEIQGTAERDSFDRKMLDRLLDSANIGINQIIKYQKSILCR